MKVHGNAALGPAGRLALAEAIESGMTSEGGSCRLLRGAGDGPSLVAPLSAASEEERQVGQLASGPTLHAPPPAPAALGGRGGADPARPPGDRPRPRPPGGDLPPRPLDDLEGACPPRALAAAARATAQTYRRYEWSRPGALLHVDVARLARFERPGHAVTGDRDQDRRREARQRGATSTCTAWSTTTAATPTSSSTETRAARPPPRCSSGRSPLRLARHEGRPRR